MGVVGVVGSGGHWNLCASKCTLLLAKNSGLVQRKAYCYRRSDKTLRKVQQRAKTLMVAKVAKKAKKASVNKTFLESPDNIISNGKKARKQYDKLWRLAARAPMFCAVKESVVGNDVKKVHRTVRFISTHALNVAASGAAANVAKMMELECKALYEDAAPENVNVPWMPRVSKGAKMVLEQFLCSLSQEATEKAHAVRESSGNPKRLNSKHMETAWGVVNEKVFGNGSFLPRDMYAGKPTVTASGKKKAGKKQHEAPAVEASGDGEDEAYDPPQDDNTAE